MPASMSTPTFACPVCVSPHTKHSEQKPTAFKKLTFLSAGSASALHPVGFQFQFLKKWV